MWKVSKITVKIINKAIRKRKESRNRSRVHERGEGRKLVWDSRGGKKGNRICEMKTERTETVFLKIKKQDL